MDTVALGGDEWLSETRHGALHSVTISKTDLRFGSCFYRTEPMRVKETKADGRRCTWLRDRDSLKWQRRVDSRRSTSDLIADDL